MQVRWCSSSPSDQQKEPEFNINDALDAELASNPKLAIFDKPTIQRAHEVFMRAGFTEENAFKAIKKHPQIVRFQPKRLQNALECWRGCQFTNSQYIQLFVQCPELLEFDNEKELGSRIAHIKMFAERAKNIWRLLMASPDILTDSPKVVEAKANYLRDVMKVDVSDAVKSSVFSHSLTKLKCRHMLLVRLGIYKEKSKNANPLDPNKNPRVARIIDHPDAEFATKICGISIAELHAFYSLYRRELEEQEDTDEESDLDDDGDESEDEFNPTETTEYDPRHRRHYEKHVRKPKNKTS